MSRVIGPMSVSVAGMSQEIPRLEIEGSSILIPVFIGQARYVDEDTEYEQVRPGVWEQLPHKCSLLMVHINADGSTRPATCSDPRCSIMFEVEVSADEPAE